MTPSIGTWLKETRLRQVDPETGRPWSQARLAETVTSETGWTLLRENYSRYESGATTPTPETLARFVEFWQAHGEPGPDLTPQPDPLPVEAQAVAATVDVAAAIREQTSALMALLEAANRRAEIAEQRLDAIETVLLNMTNRPGVDPRDVAEAEAARERLVGSESSPPQRRLTDAGRGQR